METLEYSMKSNLLSEMENKPVQTSLFSFNDSTSKDEKTQENEDKCLLELWINGFRIAKYNPEGNPIGKQSDRNYVQRIKKGENKGDVMTFINKNTGKLDVIQVHYQPANVVNTSKYYSSQIKAQLPERWEPLDQDVIIDQVDFIFVPPSSWSKKKKDSVVAGAIIYKTTSPDWDNLCKLLFDAMEDAGVYKNDSRICHIKNIRKIYGFKPGIKVKLSVL